MVTATEKWPPNLSSALTPASPSHSHPSSQKARLPLSHFSSPVSALVRACNSHCPQGHLGTQRRCQSYGGCEGGIQLCLHWCLVLRETGALLSGQVLGLDATRGNWAGGGGKGKGSTVKGDARGGEGEGERARGPKKNIRHRWVVLNVDEGQSLRRFLGKAGRSRPGRGTPCGPPSLTAPELVEGQNGRWGAALRPSQKAPRLRSGSPP